MPQKASKPTSAQAFDQAWKKFHEEHYGVDVVPEGWINAYEYADLNGISVAAADGMLRRAATAGLATLRKFRIKSDTGLVRYITHFKLTKP